MSAPSDPSRFQNLNFQFPASSAPVKKKNKKELRNYNLEKCYMSCGTFISLCFLPSDWRLWSAFCAKLSLMFRSHATANKENTGSDTTLLRIESLPVNANAMDYRLSSTVSGTGERTEVLSPHCMLLQRAKWALALLPCLQDNGIFFVQLPRLWRLPSARLSVFTWNCFSNSSSVLSGRSLDIVRTRRTKPKDTNADRKDKKVHIVLARNPAAGWRQRLSISKVELHKKSTMHLPGDVSPYRTVISAAHWSMHASWLWREG